MLKIKKKRVYIIAEVGPNHQGSLSKAKKYISKLASIGVDAVKFQMGEAEEHYSLDSIKPDYQKKKHKKQSSYYRSSKKTFIEI